MTILIQVLHGLPGHRLPFGCNVKFSSVVCHWASVIHDHTKLSDASKVAVKHMTDLLWPESHGL